MTELSTHNRPIEETASMSIGEINPYAHLSPRDLLLQEIHTKRVDSVPISDIVVDVGIVDDNHVAALAESINGPRGQLANIIVRARLGPENHILYDIIDGFHRAKALQTLGKETAICNIIYGCSDEELFDLRVLAVNSVRSVSYARIADWMLNSFRQTQWHARGLNLVQVCSLAMQGSSGVRLGLTPEESIQVQAWIEQKAQLWGRPVATIFNIARANEAAAPGLIYQVRVGGGGPHGKQGEISPARFDAIVIPLAGEYVLQKKLLAVVLEHNFVAKDTELLAKHIAFFKDIPQLVDDILNDPIHTLDLIKKSDLLPSSTTELVPQSKQKETLFLYSRKRKKILLEAPKSNSEVPKIEIPENHTGLHHRIAELESQLRISTLWWRNAEYLSTNETRCLVLFLEEGRSLEESAIKMGLLPRNFIQLIQSAFRKYLIYLQQKGLIQLENQRDE